MGAESNWCHMEGYSNRVNGTTTKVPRCHIEGGTNNLAGDGTFDTCHIEGYNSSLSSMSGNVKYSHLEGLENTLTGPAEHNHVEGYLNLVEGVNGAHVEGKGNTIGLSTNYNTRGDYSHAEGMQCSVWAKAAHAQGIGTQAAAPVQMTMGRYNVINRETVAGKEDTPKYFLIIGNGSGVNGASDASSDAFKIDYEGKIYTGNNTYGVDVSKCFANGDSKIIITDTQITIDNVQYDPGVTFVVGNDSVNFTIAELQAIKSGGGGSLPDASTEQF